jgi:hypothetical protein
LSKFAFIFIWLISVCNSCDAEIYLYYINGAHKSSESQAHSGRAAFKQVMQKTGALTSSLAKGVIEAKNLRFIDNSGYSSFAALYQISVSDAALDTTNTDLNNPNKANYYNDLGRRYKILSQMPSTCISLPYAQWYLPGGLLASFSCDAIKKSVSLTVDSANEIKKLLLGGNQVILVGHSQGNLYAEAISAILYSDQETTNRLTNQYRVIGIANTAATTFNNRHVTASQDGIIYSDLTSIPYIKWRPMSATHDACTFFCIVKPATPLELFNYTGDRFAHAVKETYLNDKLDFWSKDKTYHLPPNEIISRLIFQSWAELKRTSDTKKSTKINVTSTQLTLTSPKLAWFPNALNKSLTLLGISDVVAQTSSDLFAHTSTTYTVRVDGIGFDNNEAVTIDGSTCDATTIQRGSGFFTQTCKGGNQAGNNNKIRVYDTQYDLDIEVPAAYQYMSLRGPVLAPTAPVLTDLGSGTIRSAWGAVSGVTSYELYIGQALIATTQSSQTTYDQTNQLAGSKVCYRVRALSSGVASAYSAETCITLAAPTCTGVWTSGQIPVGMFEGTVQNCPTGYTGNKQLRHTCQAGGIWGPIVTENYCTILPTITCAGAWSTAKYQVNQTESKTAACTGGQTGSVITNHICRSNGTFGPTVETISCACPAGKVLLNGVCITPPPTSCNGAWTNTSYAIGAVEEQYASACPVGTVGQVRSFHTCQAGGIWSPTANSDNCTPVLVAPTGLIASSVGVDSGIAGVRLVWTAVSGATNYIINRNGSANYSSLAGTNWTDPYVTAGIQYCYTVNAFSSFNNTRSPDSTQFCATYQPTQNTIQPPTNFAAGKGTNANGQKGIVLSWTAALGADSYLIYRRGYSNPYTSAAFLAPTNGADVSFVDLWSIFSGSIVTGQSYCYFIRAQKNGTSSLDSNEGCSVAP